MAYVTQAPSIYLDLTVRENLRYFGQMLGVDAARINVVAEAVGLTQHLATRVGSLSGGERSRASLAVALLNTVLPYNVAFKLVTVSGPLMLPAAAYYFAKGMRTPWPGPPAFAVAAFGTLVQTRTDWKTEANIPVDPWCGK